MKKIIISLAAIAALSGAAFAGSYDGDSRPFDIRDIAKQSATDTNAFTAKKIIKVAPAKMTNWDARNDSTGKSN
jgi:hypothetical protein